MNIRSPLSLFDLWMSSSLLSTARSSKCTLGGSGRDWLLHCCHRRCLCSISCCEKCDAHVNGLEPTGSIWYTHTQSITDISNQSGAVDWGASYQKRVLRITFPVWPLHLPRETEQTSVEHLAGEEQIECRGKTGFANARQAYLSSIGRGLFVQDESSRSSCCLFFQLVSFFVVAH